MTRPKQPSPLDSEPEFEQEPYHDDSGNQLSRLVLLPNAYPLSTPWTERRQYRGRDLWAVETWREIETLLGMDTPAEWVRESVRHAVFNYVAHARPFFPPRLEWDADAGTFRRVARRARAYSDVRDILDALGVIERTAKKLWKQLHPLPLTGEKRNLVRFHTLDKLAQGAMQWRQSNPPGRLEGNGGREYLLTLLEVIERLPEVASQARLYWSPRPRPGRRSDDKGNLVVLVWRIAHLFETCRGTPAKKPWWNVQVEAYDGDDSYRLLETIGSNLPRLTGTLGATTATGRAQAFRRAFDEIRTRAKGTESVNLDIMAPLTVRHLLSEGQNRPRRRRK